MASKVRIGMIGCGGIARWHMSHLSKVPDAEIVGLCDPDPAQIARCHDQFPHLRELPVFTDFRELLANLVCEAVEISTPHTQHVEQVVAAFEAGKHVMCEKPLVTATADAHTVIAARNRASKVGLIGYQRHMIPEYQYVRRKIQSGEFGQVTFVAALQTQEWKRLTKGTWRQDPSLSGGGQLNDSGSHFVDIMLWTTGLEPVSVAAFCDNRQTPVDIDSSVSIKFKNGAMGSISIVGDAPNWHEDFSIYCERGAFYVRDSKLTVIDADGTKLHVENLPRGNDNPDAHFVACILGREEPLAPFECGLNVIQLTEAAWRSAEAGGSAVRV